MQFTLGELKNMETALKELSKKEVPIRASFLISRFLKKVNEELVIIEEERVKLVKKYGEEKDGITTVSPNKINDFKKDIEEFLLTKIEIEVSPISLQDIGDIYLSPQDMISIEKIIKE